MSRFRVNALGSIIIAVVSFACSSALAVCDGAAVAKPTKDATAVRLGAKIFFRTSGVALDFDGNPHAYGVRDQGEENICAGLAPLAPPCRGKYRGACYPVCQKTFAEWSRKSGDPRVLGRTMCSVGLGGARCSKPDVHLQAAPHDGWFVSETSLRTSPPSGELTSKWLRSQSAQLDPNMIRYLVAPSALMRAPWNAKLGDVGIAFSAASFEPIAFIVGDGGGLGEGSVSLLRALRPDDPPRLKSVLSALGEPVMRYTSGIDGDFRFAIFTGTASNVHGKNVTSKSAAQLAEWIDRTAKASLQDLSSREEIFGCSSLAPAIRK